MLLWIRRLCDVWTAWNAVLANPDYFQATKPSIHNCLAGSRSCLIEVRVINRNQCGLGRFASEFPQVNPRKWISVCGGKSIAHLSARGLIVRRLCANPNCCDWPSMWPINLTNQLDQLTGLIRVFSWTTLCVLWTRAQCSNGVWTFELENFSRLSTKGFFSSKKCDCERPRCDAFAHRSEQNFLWVVAKIEFTTVTHFGLPYFGYYHLQIDLSKENYFKFLFFLSAKFVSYVNCVISSRWRF